MLTDTSVPIGVHVDRHECANRRACCTDTSTPTRGSEGGGGGGGGGGGEVEEGGGMGGESWDTHSIGVSVPLTTTHDIYPMAEKSVQLLGSRDRYAPA